MTAGLFGLAILMAKLFPTTPTGRWIHLHLVEIPMHLASKVETKHVVFMLIGIFAWQAFAVVAPLDLALVAAWDVAIYVDVVACVWTVAAVTRGKAAFWTFKAKLRRFTIVGAKRPMPRKRAPRARRNRVFSNDNEDEAGPSIRAA